MTTTLDPATLPCPEGWRWELAGDDAALYAPCATNHNWSAAMAPGPGGWHAFFDPAAPTCTAYEFLDPTYPTPIAAARAALIALADAGHPEAAALRAAAGEAPSGPTRQQIAALLYRLGTAGPDEPIALTYDPDRDPAKGQPTDGWSVEIGHTTHHGPAALDALVAILSGDSDE